jgi:hypothetical protein
MWTLLAAWSFTTSRRLFQIGILVGGIGAGFIALGAVGMSFRRRAPVDPAAAPTPRAGGLFVSPALIIASVLLVAGFILMLLAIHYGVSPWSPRK